MNKIIGIFSYPLTCITLHDSLHPFPKQHNIPPCMFATASLSLPHWASKFTLPKK